MSELWICEYSPIQDCFHVDTLEKSLEINRATLNCGHAPCYIPLGVFESLEETETFCCEWKKKIHNHRQRKETI